jgi:hypothetical protein
MPEIVQTALAILASIGVGGGMVLGLGGWLGKVWANRIMEADRAAHAIELEELRTRLEAESRRQLASIESDLAVFREKHLKTHQDKITIYRAATDIVAGLLAEMTVGSWKSDVSRKASVRYEFEKARLRLYGYLGMLAPQSVMDAHDRLLDLLLAVVNDERTATWAEVRELAVALLNAIRIDIGVDASPIQYRGVR